MPIRDLSKSYRLLNLKLLHGRKYSEMGNVIIKKIFLLFWKVFLF